MVRKVTIKTCFITFIIFILGMYFMRNSITTLETISNGYGVIDLTSGWTRTKIIKHFTKLGIVGRQYYRDSFYLIDFVYPFLYGFFYSIILRYLLVKSKIGVYLQFLIYIPLIAIFLDLCENVVVISMLNSFPSISNLQADLFNLSNIGKFVCVYFSLISIVMLGTIDTIIKVKNRKASNFC